MCIDVRYDTNAMIHNSIYICYPNVHIYDLKYVLCSACIQWAIINIVRAAGSEVVAAHLYSTSDWYSVS